MISTGRISQPARPLFGPLVSVIVPTYNRAMLLQAAIASVLCQSWQNFEVVVVDDGSTDATPAVVAEIAEKDKRVRYLRRKNGGVSAARNTGLSQARGELIAFLDSDDAWLPWKLSMQVSALMALPDVGMVWTDMDAVGPDGEIRCQNYLKTMYSAYRRIGQGTLFQQSSPLRDLANNFSSDAPDGLIHWGRVYSQMLFGNLVHTSTVVLRRERAAEVGLFDESMKWGGEDYKFHLATTRLGPVAFIDVASIRYRIGSVDQITNPVNQVHFASAFLNTVEHEFATHSDAQSLAPEDIAAIRADAHDWLATALIETGARAAAARHAATALRLRLRTPGAWKTLMKAGLPQPVVQLVRAARGALRTNSATRDQRA